MAAAHDTTSRGGSPAGPHAGRDPQAVARARAAVAIWLLVLAGIFWSRGYHWGAALLAPAALHLWLARRLFATARRQH
jgi:hypothetical protein